MPPREPVGCNSEVGPAEIEGRAKIRRFMMVRDDEDKVVRPGSQRMSHAFDGVRKANNAAVPAAAAPGEIPWRTSRRLQEATFKLIQERDGGPTYSHVSIKESGSRSVGPLAARFQRQRHCPSEPAEKEKDLAEVGESLYLANADQVLPAMVASSCLTFRRKLKRRRKMQFHDPLKLLVRDDENKSTSSNSGNAAESYTLDHVSTSTTAINNPAAERQVDTETVGSGTQTKQPQSCFDLLCSHVGLRGWRCYRSRIAGQPFCIYHRSQTVKPHRSMESVCT